MARLRPPAMLQRRCSVLTGNRLDAATDAGSFPEREWLDEITKPLLVDKTLDVTGGLNVSNDVTPFQKFLAQLEPREETGVSAAGLHPSSRNTAFRRQAWADVGGYPEWLTLAAEDALFTHELHLIGKKFFYSPQAIVHWTVRETEAAYLKLLHRNGYGGAEAGLYAPYFRRRAFIAICPLLLLLSRHRFRYFRFRWLKNYSSARGWVDGKLFGHRPPPGWQYVDNILLSPEAQRRR